VELHSITARLSDAVRPYISATFPYENTSARELAEACPYYFRSVSYENRAAERLAAEFSYETPAFPYKNTARGLYSGYVGDRRAGFSYETLVNS
jgi:hypothetical protein